MTDGATVDTATYGPLQHDAAALKAARKTVRAARKATKTALADATAVETAARDAAREANPNEYPRRPDGISIAEWVKTDTHTHYYAECKRIEALYADETAARVAAYNADQRACWAETALKTPTKKQTAQLAQLVEAGGTIRCSRTDGNSIKGFHVVILESLEHRGLLTCTVHEGTEGYGRHATFTVAANPRPESD